MPGMGGQYHRYIHGCQDIEKLHHVFEKPWAKRIHVCP